MNQKNIKDKMVKRIMALEKQLFMPQHIPQGTEGDPTLEGMREFSQEEKDNCTCSNCKYPFEYWNIKSDEELQKELSRLEHLKANPV